MLSTQKPTPEPADPQPAPVPDPIVEVVAPPPPVVEPTPAPTPTTVHETVLSMDLTEYDLEGPTVHEGVPDPPECIKRKLVLYEKVWRWLSKPHVEKKGMRQYTAYSPDREDKVAMQKGDCPAGVHVSVDNRLCWGEDAFLGFSSRRFFEQRQVELDRLNARLLKQSKEATEFTEFAKKAGFKSPSVDVENERPRYKGR